MQADDPSSPVIIAYDGSPSAREAIHEAARRFGSFPMLVVTVWDVGLGYTLPTTPQDAASMTAMLDPEVTQDIADGLHHHAEALARGGAGIARSLGLDAEPLTVPQIGSVAESILELSFRRRAAAIVTGSRGLKGLRARLEGSTSRTLVRHARCPVVVVHEPVDSSPR